MSTLFRKMHLKRNPAGAVDLMLAKSSGGEFVRILMGNPENATLVALDLQILSTWVMTNNPAASMPNGRKNVRAVLNMAGGHDLVIDRDGGNPVLIQTGRQWRKFWTHLEILATEALEEIELLERWAEQEQA